MTREEAIAIIRKEYLCVDRDCGIEKNCGRCDLMMPSKEPILEAYKMAIQALEQEPKTGHWIEHPEIETSTPEYLMFYECSECGDKQCFCKSDIHKKRFCNNCGARMESEE